MEKATLIILKILDRLKLRYFSNGYGSKEFDAFMRKETFIFDISYAKKKVEIFGEKYLDINSRTGGVFCFLHYGSFFLSGVALVHLIGIKYTAVASKSNHRFLSNDEESFWLGVFKRVNNLYSRDLFFSEEKPKKLIDWLIDENYLGVAIDVIEPDRSNKLSNFEFFGSKVIFQTSAARIARISGKPLIPLTIRHCPWTSQHKLFIGKPIMVSDEVQAIKEALQNFERLTLDHKYQYFHDIPLLYKAQN